MTESASAATALAKPRVLYVGADGKLRADLSIPEIADVIRSGSGELWVDELRLSGAVRDPGG